MQKAYSQWQKNDKHVSHESGIRQTCQRQDNVSDTNPCCTFLQILHVIYQLVDNNFRAFI